MEKQQREQVDRNIREAKEKLEAEMEAARHEHQLMLMRQGKNGLRCVCGVDFFSYEIYLCLTYVFLNLIFLDIQLEFSLLVVKISFTRKLP